MDGWSHPVIKRSATIQHAFLISEGVLLVVALLGDVVQWQWPWSRDSSVLLGLYLPALLDSATHAAVAGLIWWTAISADVRRHPSRPSHVPMKRAGLEAAGAFVAGCVVDLDHFASAGSLQLRDATSLRSRPMGHCLTIAILEAVLVWVMTEALQAGRGWGLRAALLALSAGVSHQLRDSIRRGIWLCPLGSTPKLPYQVYMLLLACMPIGLRAALARVGGSPGSVLYSHFESWDPQGTELQL